MRPSDLPIHLDPTSPLPISRGIAVAIEKAIRTGILSPGAILPGTRTLCKRLGVSRGTVVSAFEELTTMGWLDSQSGRGSRVAAAPPSPQAASSSRPLQSAFDMPTRPSWGLEDAPPLAKLSHGVPDARLVPSELLGRAYARALRRRSADVLDLIEDLGEQELQQELALFLREWQGLAHPAEAILPTRGAQHAFTLAAHGLLAPGDAVAVEDPGNPRALEAFRQSGARIVPIPVDQDGLDVDALEAYLRRSTLRLLYVTPRYQVPTTVTLSPERRQRLLALARLHRFAILEDDSEGLYTLDGRSLPPLAAGEGAASVIYLFSFSRLLAPGLRLGCMTGPAEAMGRLSHVSQRMDTLGDLTLGRAFASLLRDRDIHRHVLKARRAYQERRDHVVERLQHRFGPAFQFEVPSGGLSLWLRCREDFDLEGWCRACAKVSIRLQPGRAFAWDQRPIPGLPLAFGAHTPLEMDRILSRMQQALPLLPYGAW